jgi:predicted DNA-binding ribbon-helix-helix protein
MGDLYDHDFYAWANEQAELLRAGRLSAADIANIAEEIESMGRGEKRELASRLRVLLLHMLKWQNQPERQGNSWRLSIDNARDDITEHLADNPSLKTKLPEVMDTAYRHARRDAAIETGIALAAFPAQCPWTFDEAMREQPGTE